MGRAALRHEVLARRGPLITMAADQCQESAEASSSYIKHQLEMATGVSLTLAEQADGGDGEG